MLHIIMVAPPQTHSVSWFSRRPPSFPGGPWRVPLQAVFAQDWLRVRGNFLAASYELKFENCEKDLLTQEASLGSFTEHNETISVVRDHSFCQLNLIYL